MKELFQYVLNNFLMTGLLGLFYLFGALAVVELVRLGLNCENTKIKPEKNAIIALITLVVYGVFKVGLGVVMGLATAGLMLTAIGLLLWAIVLYNSNPFAAGRKIALCWRVALAGIVAFLMWVSLHWILPTIYWLIKATARGGLLFILGTIRFGFLAKRQPAGSMKRTRYVTLGIVCLVAAFAVPIFIAPKLGF